MPRSSTRLFCHVKSSISENGWPLGAMNAAIVLAVSEWLLDAIISAAKSSATWLARKNAADFLVRQAIQQTIDAAREALLTLA